MLALHNKSLIRIVQEVVQEKNLCYDEIIVQH